MTTLTAPSLEIFEFIPGINLRVIRKDGEPWFVVKDVCDALGLAPNARNGSYQGHMRRLASSEFEVATISNGRRSYIVTESGLYALVLMSRKPEAQRFRHWVTSVVLPAIRRG